MKSTFFGLVVAFGHVHEESLHTTSIKMLMCIYRTVVSTGILNVQMRRISVLFVTFLSF